MDCEQYYKEKLEEEKEKCKLLEIKNDYYKSNHKLLIFLLFTLLVIILISVFTNGTTINNEGYTIEQVTNATIQICKALR